MKNMQKLFEFARREAWRQILFVMGKAASTPEEMAAANKEKAEIESQIAKAKQATGIVEQLVARFGNDITNDEEIDGGDAVEFLVNTLSEALAIFKPTESVGMEYFQGGFNANGVTLRAEFQVPVGASVAEKDAAFMAALAQQADINYVTIGEDGPPILQDWVGVYGENGLLFHCRAEDREHAFEQCQNAYPNDKVHVAVPANNEGQLVIQTITDDPMCCPKCGSRTEFGVLQNNMQVHVCMKCDHSFLAEHDEETSTA